MVTDGRKRHELRKTGKIKIQKGKKRKVLIRKTVMVCVGKQALLMTEIQRPNRVVQL